ncbi:OLFM4 protein, partial [Atractosteus spatula]|nr:OLFM4 protein [Atractosteus spatula]
MARVATLLLLLLPHTVASPQRVKGAQRGHTCVCSLDFSAWDFPVQRFEETEKMMEKCQDSLGELQAQVNFTEFKVPEISGTLENIIERLHRFEHLNKKGLYNALNFRLLDYELQELEMRIKDAHQNEEVDPSKSRELTNELSSIREKVQSLQKFDKFNLLALKENLRTLRNRLESCRTLDSNHLGQCSRRLLSNISSPVVTQLSPFGKSYPFGSWGKETMEGKRATYWVQALVNSNKYGNVLRTYASYTDFMFSKNHNDFTVTSSHSSTNAIQGPGSVLYDEAFYYNCYRTANLCKYDLKTKTILHATLPGAGFNDKFPYCYYSCYDSTDIDFAADEKGLWVIYATEENYGNMVVSKLNTSSLAVIQTWRTRLFKKSVTNTFMVCGVLYATRYVNTYREEVFYAFDTKTGHETNVLSLPFEKISGRIQNLHYNPRDQRLYLFNDAYMMAYELFF